MAPTTMWDWAREDMLGRRDFYVEEAKKRIIRSFGNLKEDADKFLQEFYDPLNSG